MTCGKMGYGVLTAATLAAVAIAASHTPLARAAAAPAAKTFRLPDGVEMSYVVAGKGDPALVFVHCGNCRKEIWTETLDAFSPTHRVVAMDLPGHGRSGANRKDWSLPGLGADVAALVEHLKLTKVILVGNSMGGPVSLEAARRLGPTRVRGLVAVDTLHNVEAKWPAEHHRRMVESYQAGFEAACSLYMLSLLPKDGPIEAKQRVDRETCGNDAKAAIALLGSMLAYDQAAAMKAAGVPVRAINAPAFPTAADVNRRYAPSFEVIVMDGVGHYPQVERPAEFQAHLRKIIQSLP